MAEAARCPEATTAADNPANSTPTARRTRTIPAPIRRALEHRDRGCRFPGCGLRFCDAHHVVHWADGGATRLDNLVLLCRRHHRAVHEEVFGVRIENGQAVFHAPDGRRIPDAPSAPELGDAPVARMRTKQERLGIDARTTLPTWAGERLDLDWSVRVLRAG